MKFILNDDPLRVGVRYSPLDPYVPGSPEQTLLVLSLLPDELSVESDLCLPESWDLPQVRYWGFRYDRTGDAPLYSFGCWFFNIFLYNPQGFDWSFLYWLTGWGDRPPFRP